MVVGLMHWVLKQAAVFCPGKEAALVIIVVSLPCTAYLCGSLIVFCRRTFYLTVLHQTSKNQTSYRKNTSSFIALCLLLLPHRNPFAAVGADVNVFAALHKLTSKLFVIIIVPHILKRLIF